MLLKNNELIISIEEINSGLLSKLNSKCAGAFSVLIILFINSINKETKIKLFDLCKLTGFSLGKVVKCLRFLEENNMIFRKNKHIFSKPRVYDLSPIYDIYK